VTYVLLLRGDKNTCTAKEVINKLNSESHAIAFPIFLQDLSHPQAYCRLSSQVYHLLRRKNWSTMRSSHGLPRNSHLQQSTFTIASVPESNKVSFALRWPAPVLDIIEGERTLHVAYSMDTAAKSALSWCMDDCGQAWKRHEWRYDEVDLAVQDVWAFAMVFTGMANVHWRLVITKYGDLTYPEVQGEFHGSRCSASY
jgi:hypothetical protein